MAAVSITATDVPAGGLNLTDATFSTLVAGAGNGVKFPYNSEYEIILKNDTGGAAVFTIDVADQAALTAIGVTTQDKTISVANNKTYVLKMNYVYNVSDYVTITCDVAGKVLILNLN